jgi:hypothetical protein
MEGSMGQDENSLELIFEVARDALKAQQDQKMSLENKANMLLLFAGGIFALLMNSWNTIVHFLMASQVIILASVSFFAASVILAISAIWVQKYRIDPNPYELAQNFLNSPEEETKLQLISNWADTWKVNLNILERNSYLLRLSFLTQVIAFFLLGIALFVSIFR